MKKEQTNLQKILSNHFVKFSLIPILVVEVTLIVMYFSINAYISSKNTNLLLNEAQKHTQTLLENEAKFISDKLTEVSRTALLLQSEHQNIFTNPNAYGLPNGKPNFDVATNGVFYKTNKEGSSLYYSAKTKQTQNTRNKAIVTEAMDPSFKSVVDLNPNIVAAYFNSWDNMNRLYPFIDDVHVQYGEHINMEDYNFYYLAMNKYNPTKEHAWTGAYLDPAGNGWMLSCIVPIYNDKFLEGVTGIDITIDSFVKNILNRELPYNANLFMVDETGMIIAMSEKIESLLGLKELKEHLYTDAILKTIEKPEEFNLFTNESPFASHFKKLIENKSSIDRLKINGEEYLTLNQNVEETNWKLMILIDENEIFLSINELKDLSNKIGYAAIVLLVLFYFVFFYFLLRKIKIFSSDITKPIASLSEKTTEIKRTDAQIEVFDTNVSEIYQLNINFANMMKELNEKTKKIYESKLLAEQASRAKDDFLANMSHELKTPLNSINVISDIMMKNKKENLNEKEVKNLSIINKCGKDLLFLINDVLDISKLEAGEIILNEDSFDVKDFVKNMYDMFYPQTKSKNIDFVLEVDDNLGLIYSDEDRVKQIVKNLLSNALKFTSENKRISLLVSDENEYIKIIVKDEGIGIPQDKLENIFDRFKQVDGSTTRNFGGTGLGLAISKELVTLLKGDIAVQSVEDVGSEFIIRLPKNLELLKSIELLDMKNDLNMKNELIVLNNNPVELFNLIVKLSNKYKVIQVKNIEKLNEHKNKTILVDIDSLSKEEVDFLIMNFTNDLVLISKESQNEDIINKVKKVILKPLDLNNLDI